MFEYIMEMNVGFKTVLNISKTMLNEERAIDDLLEIYALDELKYVHERINFISWHGKEFFVEQKHIG